MTTTLKGRTYEVTELSTPELTAAHLRSNGWDGKMYTLTGKRNACYLAYRNPETGKFSIVFKA